MNAKRITQLRSYLNKTFYQGRGISWLIQNEEGEHVYCDKCGNFANGVVAVRTTSGRLFNVPMCTKHLREAFPEEEIVCPTTIPYERKPKAVPDNKLRDRFGEEITEGSFVDVQNNGVHKVWELNGELLFAPYGKLERVKDYFSADLEVKDGCVSRPVHKPGIEFTPQLEEDLDFHINQLFSATEHLSKRRVATPGLGMYHHTMKFTLRFLKDLRDELQRTKNTVQSGSEVR